jgi:hypothetical protein
MHLSFCLSKMHVFVGDSLTRRELVRLIPVTSARPLGATARPPGATTRCRGHGSGTGRWGWCLPRPDGTASVGAELGGSVRTTTCRWDRWTVVTRWLVIDPFELKFDHLN